MTKQKRHPYKPSADFKKIVAREKLVEGPRPSQFNIRLSGEELELLKKTALSHGVTASEFARHAIRMASGLPSMFTAVFQGSAIGAAQL